MIMSKEALIRDIEEARIRLNTSIDNDEANIIYSRSVELDELIERYIEAGY